MNTHREKTHREFYLILLPTPFRAICSTELLIPHTSGSSNGCKLDRINDIFVVIVHGLAFSKFAINSKGLKEG